MDEEAERRDGHRKPSRLDHQPAHRAGLFYRGEVVLAGPVSRIEAKTLSQPYDPEVFVPDDC